LHDVLHERTQELGVVVELNRKAESIDGENGIVRFECGEAVKADLIVAADGERYSSCLRIFPSSESALRFEVESPSHTKWLER
jgi:flavin-dependent dehydrogenase